MAIKKGKKLVRVDFTGVEAGGGGKLLPEGPIQLEVEEVEQLEGEESKQPYLNFTFTVSEGEYEGTKAWDNMSLQSQALWKLRGFMEAAGLETEDGPMDIDPDELVGLNVMADIVHEEYKGKTKHRVAGYSTVEDTPAEPAAASKKKPSAKKDEEIEWKVKQKVAFMDGKKRLEGVLTKIEDDTVTVRVGKEEYEMSTSDLEAA
jgi:hypothetical protein